MMLRSRYFCPLACPGSLQALQLLHSVILQSRGLKQSAAHLFVASSGPLQGSPHLLFTFWTTRLRVQRPSQVGCCQSDHGLKVQGMGMQS